MNNSIILKFDKQGNFISWMNKLPKLASIEQDGKRIRTHDIRRVLNKEARTAGGFQWKEVTCSNLTIKK